MIIRKQSKSAAFFLLSVTALVAAVAFAEPALAASGGDAASQIKELVWQGVNLLILLGVLFAASRKPITQFFADRREEIQNDIKTADKLLSDSRRDFAQWQGKLAELEREAQTIREETRVRAQEEREQIIAGAHDAAERIKSDAVAAIDQELRRAHAELRDEAATLAIDLAKGMLNEQIDGRDRDRLMDEFIVSVEPATVDINQNGQGN
ncbi:MAG: F0F1 ATP synthase subunit B [Myxococcota bacterium]|jgi:F-type H+-transporting ATPase subunit b|nr:F0F1 ATP synthase subunit B [Myxococcota bacterium]